MLQVKGLEVAYGQAKALQGIDLEVNQGEIVAVIGRNGAGKTSLLRAVTGLAPVIGGEIHFQGKSLVGVPSDRITRLGIAHVPQGRLVFADQTVLDNLVLGAYTVREKAKVKRNIAREFSRFPRLAERRNQLAGTLSGGEQQMLAISRGLMTDPPFICLDEPSMGLAPILVEQIMATIADLKRQGITVLLVEQMATAALEIADRAYLLNLGLVRKTGTGQDLLGDKEVMRQYLGVAI
jgi:branched-chain amino acid transport system ATP-binding protein